MIQKNVINVLLVEDNEDHRILTGIAFSRYGKKYDLTVCSSLKEAEDHILLQDIIITNLYLSDGSGVEFLKNDNVKENIPVIILESFVEQETIVKLIKAGITDFISKSAEVIETLPEKVDKYIEYTELKKERRRISEQQNRLSTAIMHSSETIVVTDPEGIIEFVNPAFEKITGFSSDEAIGKKPSVLKSGRHDKNFYKKLWDTILSGEPWKGRFVNRKKNGEIYEEDASISPVFDKDGNIINFVAVKRDVSDLIRIENQLRHAQKMEGIGTLAAGIAHEINTPLQYLSDNMQFIKESFSEISAFVFNVRKIITEDPVKNEISDKIDSLFKKGSLEFIIDEIPKAIEENLNGVNIVRKIVSAMKNFSHPGLTTMKKSDMNEAVQSTLTITKNVWKYCAEVVMNLKENLPEVTCHIGDVNQVLLNMVTNATDAIKEKYGERSGGKITVTTDSNERSVYITIEDNGSGIPSESVDKIFQPFYTTKQVGKGTGQGLALSYDIIVNKHKGEIKVESEKGSGTKFTIELPIGKYEI